MTSDAWSVAVISWAERCSGLVGVPNAHLWHRSVAVGEILVSFVPGVPDSRASAGLCCPRALALTI